MSQILIKNARLVNEGHIREVDVLIKGDRITRIANSIAAGDGARVIDAAGKTLIPGMIDDQVHFREPGLTAKGDMATESAAAAAGGITSFMDMPNVNPLTVTRDALAAKYELAAGRATANYAFYLGATNKNIDEIRALRPGEACGVKIFMGASTGDMLVDDRDALESIFADAQILVATHCEDSPIIWANEAKARLAFGEDVPMSEHPNIRSADSCFVSSSLAVDLARRHGTKLHVLHLTTAKEMAHFSTANRLDKRITAEVCVHHLYFDERDYEQYGSKIKCNPAIKRAADRAALVKAVNEGRIDIIATDHAPHTWAEKQNSYFKAPAGLPLVQHALLSVLEQVHKGEFSIETVVDKTSHAVADIFGVVDRGYVREGYFADLVLIDENKPQTVTRESVLYKCGWSPYEGTVFSSTIDTTIINGRVVYEAGALTGDIAGSRLAFRQD